MLEINMRYPSLNYSNYRWELDNPAVEKIVKEYEWQLDRVQY